MVMKLLKLKIGTINTLPCKEYEDISMDPEDNKVQKKYF
jgi:hypothetical protein